MATFHPIEFMNWYYHHGDKVIGPISEAALNELINCGAIPRETLVCEEGKENWQPFEPDKNGPKAIPKEVIQAGSATKNTIKDDLSLAASALRAKQEAAKQGVSKILESEQAKRLTEKLKVDWKRWKKLSWITQAFVCAGLLCLVFLASKLFTGNHDNQRSKATYREKSELHHGSSGIEPTLIRSDKFDLYMAGYRNPDSAIVARRLLEIRPDRADQVGGQKDLLTIQGADDKIAGRPPRYKTEW